MIISAQCEDYNIIVRTYVDGALLLNLKNE